MTRDYVEGCDKVVSYIFNRVGVREYGDGKYQVGNNHLGNNLRSDCEEKISSLVLTAKREENQRLMKEAKDNNTKELAKEALKERATCFNCGKTMEEVKSDNWEIYCNAQPCYQAMVDAFKKKANHRREIKTYKK